MSTLFNAVNETAFRTDNGMPTHGESLNPCVDLFFLFGASRGKDITDVFAKAIEHDMELAFRIALWGRDVRGGAGERATFRSFCMYAATMYPEETKLLLVKIPEIGRWDDLLVFIPTNLRTDALDLIQHGLFSRNGLCAKWMPRKGVNAAIIRNHIGLTPKQYRKVVVELSNTVEQYMCANDWNNIDYSKLPSVASARYQTAFGKHDPEGYGAYIDSLKKGETKINAGAVYPYDVIRSVWSGNGEVAEEQWKALPDYLEGSNENILPVVDVSGSMMCPAGGQGSVSCMDVAISLGLYISERSRGLFRDEFITFSRNPKMQRVKGNLRARLNQMRGADWGYNTDLQAVFQTVLSAAVARNVPVEDMPTSILILSDMEFDLATGGINDKAFKMIQRQYNGAGYKTPNIIFWNLNGRTGNLPVKCTEQGFALVSGFSPSIMTSILGNEDITPEAIMLKTVMVDRYNYKR